jgi:hypothetical protein
MAAAVNGRQITAHLERIGSTKVKSGNRNRAIAFNHGLLRPFATSEALRIACPLRARAPWIDRNLFHKFSERGRWLDKNLVACPLRAQAVNRRALDCNGPQLWRKINADGQCFADRRRFVTLILVHKSPTRLLSISPWDREGSNHGPATTDDTRSVLRCKSKSLEGFGQNYTRKTITIVV